MTECGPHKSLHCVSCEGRSSNTIFCNLDQDTLEILDKNKVVRLFKKGQYVFHNGSTPSGLFCINSGIVRLESEGRSGATHIHRLVAKGGTLGYRSLFANEEYASSAYVQEDALICYIPKHAIFEMIQKYPQVGFNFLNHISKELRIIESRHKSLVDKEAPRRVAETLLQLKKNFPDIHWTRKEIAEWADTTPETVMRCFSDFKKRGFIDFNGRKVQIRNFPAFLRFANPPV